MSAAGPGTTVRAGLTAFVGAVVDGSPSLRPRKPEALRLIDRMTAGWGDRDPDGPPMISYLARDGTPFEPSVRFGRGPSDLRWVLEAQPEVARRGEVPTSRAYFEAAMALDRRLAAEGLVDLAHLPMIADVFERSLPPTTAACWFGMALGPSGPAVIKNYFVCSRADQWREVFLRFGLTRLAEELARVLAESVPRRARVEFVSLDLAGGDPRLKLYVRHRDLDFAAIDRSHALCPAYRAGDCERLVRGLFGGVPTIARLGPISTFHVSLARGAVSHSSLNVPLEPLHYAPSAVTVPSDDVAIAMAVARLVRSFGLAIDPLYPHMLSVALNDGVRYPHHRYCGLQRRPSAVGDSSGASGRDDVEVTVYLSHLLQAKRHGLAYGPQRLVP